MQSQRACTACRRRPPRAAIAADVDADGDPQKRRDPASAATCEQATQQQPTAAITRTQSMSDDRTSSDRRQPATPTAQLASRSSKAWRRCASAPACTSATPPTAPACTTWCSRWSTTRSTRRWPATATTSSSPSTPTTRSRVIDNGRGIPTGVKMDDKHEPKRSRRRDRADRAARRRQVQPEQLQGLGRPARRGRVAASTRCRSGCA